MKTELIFHGIEIIAHLTTALALAFAVYQYHMSVQLRRFDFIQSIYTRLNDPALAFDDLWEAAKEKRLNLNKSSTRNTLIAVLTEADSLADAFEKGIVKEQEILAVAYEFEMLAINDQVRRFVEREQTEARKRGLPERAYPFTGLYALRRHWKKT